MRLGPSVTYALIAWHFFSKYHHLELFLLDSRLRASRIGAPILAFKVVSHLNTVLCSFEALIESFATSIYG
jgi:hypothetical protein